MPAIITNLLARRGRQDTRDSTFDSVLGDIRITSPTDPSNVNQYKSPKVEIKVLGEEIAPDHLNRSAGTSPPPYTDTKATEIYVQEEKSDFTCYNVYDDRMSSRFSFVPTPKMTPQYSPSMFVQHSPQASVFETSISEVLHSHSMISPALTTAGWSNPSQLASPIEQESDERHTSLSAERRRLNSMDFVGLPPRPRQIVATTLHDVQLPPVSMHSPLSDIFAVTEAYEEHDGASTHDQHMISPLSDGIYSTVVSPVTETPQTSPAITPPTTTLPFRPSLSDRNLVRSEHDEVSRPHAIHRAEGFTVSNNVKPLNKIQQNSHHDSEKDESTTFQLPYRSPVHGSTTFSNPQSPFSPSSGSGRSNPPSAKPAFAKSPPLGVTGIMRARASSVSTGEQTPALSPDGIQTSNKLVRINEHASTPANLKSADVEKSTSSEVQSYSKTLRPRSASLESPRSPSFPPTNLPETTHAPTTYGLALHRRFQSDVSADRDKIAFSRPENSQFSPALDTKNVKHRPQELRYQRTTVDVPKRPRPQFPLESPDLRKRHAFSDSPSFDPEPGYKQAAGGGFYDQVRNDYRMVSRDGFTFKGPLELRKLQEAKKENKQKGLTLTDKYQPAQPPLLNGANTKDEFKRLVECAIKQPQLVPSYRDLWE